MTLAAPAQAQPRAFHLHKTAAVQAGTGLRRPAAPRYDVVALRVEFQPDTTRFTTGTGGFDGPLYADGLAPTVDPLPHDAAYFQAHLDFLADYVAQVSDGRTQVTTHLVPEVVRVSQEMGAYSPTGFEADSDPERAKLVGLVEEAWRLASEQSGFDLAGFDPERTAFVLFHAGVGRDIELLGTTLDKTPLDLPSIAFDAQALRLLGSGPISFNGFPVRNTLILPRTETRQAFDFFADENVLLELSINGLLAASFFNVLGVPDLFNTETGEPAIGPFGLMDPLGIFAYNGLFPPEPSAWTKYYLGWTEPQDLLGDGPLGAVLSTAKQGAPAKAARARLSSAEYFLIENRNRDPEGDGLVLRVWRDGAVVEQRVENGAEDFNRFDVSGFIGGVVVGVDNYDWALPGGLDEDGNELNGGILIWHVDERRLAEALALGKGPNGDPERRAIDLEEADSAQDLGFPSANPFAPASDQGTPFDFWFRDNPVVVINQLGQEIRLYENRFGPDTFPNSNANEGGASFIVLEDFSAPGPQMSFTFRREAAAGIIPLAASQALAEEGVSFSKGSALSFSDAFEVLAFAGAPPGQEGSFFSLERLMSVVIRARTATKPSVLQSGAVVHLHRRPDAGYEVTFTRRLQDDVVTGERVPLPEQLNALSPAGPVVASGDGEGVELLFAGNGQAERVSVDTDGLIEVVAVDGKTMAASDDGRFLVVGARGAILDESESVAFWSYDLPSDVRLGQAALGRDAGGYVGVVPLLERNEILFLTAGGSQKRIDLTTYGRIFASDGVTASDEGALNAFPVLVDLDDDGRLDVLSTYRRNLVAFSQNGALLPGFPIRLSAPSVAQPLVAELTGRGGWSVVVASTDGYVYAYDLGNGGRQVPGFPLAVGARIEATPLLQDKRLFAVAVDGSLQAWELENLGAIWWGQLYGKAQNQSFVALGAEDPGPQPPAPSGRLIVEAETYNWPNPIRNGETFLRCMTSDDARVQITIIDAAGTLVDEMELDLRGGTPAEHLWQTDAASGLYYARVTASGPDGRTATKLIKMAIVR